MINLLTISRHFLTEMENHKSNLQKFGFIAVSALLLQIPLVSLAAPTCSQFFLSESNLQMKTEILNNIDQLLADFPAETQRLQALDKRPFTSNWSTKISAEFRGKIFDVLDNAFPTEYRERVDMEMMIFGWHGTEHFKFKNDASKEVFGASIYTYLSGHLPFEKLPWFFSTVRSIVESPTTDLKGSYKNWGEVHAYNVGKAISALHDSNGKLDGPGQFALVSDAIASGFLLLDIGARTNLIKKVYGDQYGKRLLNQMPNQKDTYLEHLSVELVYYFKQMNTAKELVPLLEAIKEILQREAK